MANGFVISFEDIKEEVFSEFNDAEKLGGTKWTRFPKLNETLKGFRRGELTIFTGL